MSLYMESTNSTVLPGETFSFNQATGQRTAEKGYKPAAAIAGGETFDEIGGGVCQTSSTLFNAVVRANLTIVSRKPHAWPSNYVPKGEDATVNWPDLDFKFKNDTEWPIFLVAWCDKSAKTVTDLGLANKAFALYELTSGITLRHVVHRVEGEGGEERYYIPEKERYRAELRFSKEGNGVKGLVLTAIFCVVLAIALVKVLPFFLGIANSVSG